MIARANPDPEILVVDGYGVRLSVERGHLVVHNGFATDGETREVRFSRGRSSVKRVIVRASAGTVSIAALDWCQRMGITIAIVGSDSRLVNCLVPDGAHDGPLRRAQAISAVTEDALDLARWLLKQKLEAQLRALGKATSQRAAAEISSCIAAIGRDKTLTDLLAHEGNAARSYWECLVGTPLPWPDWTHKRIPTHWRMISSRASGGRSTVRDARDPFNALLNYGYTLLEVEMRIACASEGLDPDLGYLHVDSRLRESFVYDLMEPLRVDIDRLTLEWARQIGLRPHMFIELRNGVVRLDPDAARNYARVVMPKLRRPALLLAADFASKLRRIKVPYRLTGERRSSTTPVSYDLQFVLCEYCKQPVPKRGLKFCGRQCYLRHSVEIRQPVKLAQARLAEMRAQGLSPGHGGEAAKKRGEKIAESNRRRRLGLTPSEHRDTRTEQTRQRKLRPKE